MKKFTILYLLIFHPLLAQNIEVVFTDMTQGQWRFGQWSENDEPSFIIQDDIVYSGDKGVCFDYSIIGSGFGGIGFERHYSQNWDPVRMYPNQFIDFHFYFNPGPNADHIGSIRVTLDNGSNGITLTDYLPALSPNDWYEVTIPLEDLNSANRSFFRIYFFNNSSNYPLFYLDEVTLLWQNDNTPPLIENVNVENINSITSQISWSTNEHCRTICMTINDSDTTTIENEDYLLDHSALFTDLLSGTQYLLRIQAFDHQEDEATSPNITFYEEFFTTDPPDVTPPVISNIRLGDITSSNAQVLWSTDESAHSSVYYGIGEYNLVKSDTVLRTDHHIVLCNLQPETEYQFYVESTDYFNNIAQSGVDGSLHFTTASSPEVVLTVNTDNQVAQFTSNHLGVNIGNWTYYYGQPYPDDSQKLRELTKLIQPGIIRYAGGLASNRVIWTRENVQFYQQGYYDTDGDGAMDVFGRRQFINPPIDGLHFCADGSTEIIDGAFSHYYQPDEIDRLAAFADYVSSDIMIEVNVATSNPSLWADMVHYTNVEREYNIKYWELGNELDLEYIQNSPAWFPWPIQDEYVRRYKEYYNALKDVDNTILICGPTTAAHEAGYFQPFEYFIDPLTTDPEMVAKQMLDVFTYHLYPNWNGGGNIVNEDTLFLFYRPNNPDRSRSHGNDCARTKRQLLDDRGFVNTPIAITEFNAIAADQYTYLLLNHANALYMADMLGRLAYHGADMIMHWELYDEHFDNGTSFGLIEINRSRISINNYSSGEVSIDDQFEPMSVYYTYFMYARLFGNQMVESSSSDEEKISIWASTDESNPGAVMLMITNMTNETVNATIDMGDYTIQNADTYVLLNEEFTSNEDGASIVGGTTINGLEINSQSAYDIFESAQGIINSAIPMDIPESVTTVTKLLPAYSVTLLVLNGNDGALTLPAPLPQPPKILDPHENGQQIPRDAMLGWHPQSISDSYHLQISIDSHFENLVVDKNNLDVNYFKLTGLDGMGTYYGRLNATNSLGTSDWSPVFYFQTTSSSGFWADIDRDGDVDILDVQLVAARWNSHAGDPNYDPRCDVDNEGQGDGDIDILDVQLVASWWNKPIPPLNRPQLRISTAVTKTPSLTLRWSESAELPTVEVWIEDAVDLAGFEMSLVSQSGKLDIERVEAGELLMQAANSVHVLGPTLSEGKDRITMGIYSFGSNTGSTGTGMLAKIVLKGGRIPITSEDVQLVDNAGHPVALTNVSNHCAEGWIRIPEHFFMDQNYPNPFNASTKIRYGLPEKGHVRIEIFNLSGRHIETLIDEERSAGSYEVLWDAKGLSSGIYLARMETGAFIRLRKLILQK